MPLKPNMNTYAWNRLYIGLCVGILPSLAQHVAEVEITDWRDVTTRVILVLSVAAGILHSFVQSPEK
jgi:hypothetical protein